MSYCNLGGALISVVVVVVRVVLNESNRIESRKVIESLKMSSLRVSRPKRLVACSSAAVEASKEAKQSKQEEAIKGRTSLGWLQPSLPCMHLRHAILYCSSVSRAHSRKKGKK